MGDHFTRTSRMRLSATLVLAMLLVAMLALAGCASGASSGSGQDASGSSSSDSRSSGMQSSSSRSSGSESSSGSSDGISTSSGVKPRDTVEEYSWEDLARISELLHRAEDDGDALEIAKQYNLVNAEGELDGTQTKTISMYKDFETKATIIGFNHDEPTYWTMRAGLTFAFCDTILVDAMDGDGSNAGGWEGSEARELLSTQSHYWLKLPTELKEAITKVDKRTNNVGEATDASCVSITEDGLWLLSATEVFGDIGWYEGSESYANGILDDEGHQYKLFEDLGITGTEGMEAAFPELARSYPGGLIWGDSSTWWLRSPCPLDGTSFYCVASEGMPAVDEAERPLGILVGFCI